MPVSIDSLIKAITAQNNRYRDRSSSVAVKLESLWDMGDTLVRMGVTKPHTFGWAVQRQTKGLIKRPMIFRSHKIRSIWPSKEAFMRDVGRIPQTSRLKELLPLIDPAQHVREQLGAELLVEIFRHAREDSDPTFRAYVWKLKKQHASGKLGKPLDRSKYLGELKETVTAFEAFRDRLLHLLADGQIHQREAFRKAIEEEELKAFANMCISLTTKDNFRLYKRSGPHASTSRDEGFRALYDYYRGLLEKKSDVERARLRRLISAEAFAQMSDAISSIRSEDGVQDYRDRQKMSIEL